MKRVLAHFSVNLSNTTIENKILFKITKQNGSAIVGKATDSKNIVSVRVNTEEREVKLLKRKDKEYYVENHQLNHIEEIK